MAKNLPELNLEMLHTWGLIPAQPFAQGGIGTNCEIL